MSDFDQSFPAAQIAREVGIQVSVDDVPKLVAALHRAYGTGLRDGADSERQACALHIQSCRPPVADTGRRVEIGLSARMAYARAIRERGAA